MRKPPRVPANYFGLDMGEKRRLWKERSRADRTDWSSLLRQRKRAEWWVKLGRPSMSEFIAAMTTEEEGDDG